MRLYKNLYYSVIRHLKLLQPVLLQILHIPLHTDWICFLCWTLSDGPPLPSLCHPPTRDCLHWEFDTLEETPAMCIQGVCVCVSFKKHSRTQNSMCASLYDAHDWHPWSYVSEHLIWGRNSPSAANSISWSVSLCGRVALAGWSRCPVEVREALPQQLSFPGSAHQTRVSGLEVQNHILGAETDAQCGLWPAYVFAGQTRCEKAHSYVLPTFVQSFWALLCLEVEENMPCWP